MGFPLDMTETASDKVFRGGNNAFIHKRPLSASMHTLVRYTVLTLWRHTARPDLWEYDLHGVNESSDLKLYGTDDVRA